MKPLEDILRNAASAQKTIVLSEGTDPRVVQAALDARKQDVAKIILVLDNGPDTKRPAALDETIDGLEVHDPSNSPLTQELADLYYSMRKHKGISPEQALEQTKLAHVYAALLVKAGHADGCIGGAVLSSAEVIKTAIQVIGVAEGTKLVSSFFLFLFCEDHHTRKGACIFSDAGLVVDPSAEELCEIAIASARSFQDLTNEQARIAMLSFSTRGSAQHHAVSKVQKATDLARAAAPDLLIDGELQFDAAFVPEVAQSKAADSPIAGNANVFIFPNLDAGNIGYKIAQRIGGATAIGPILQGLSHPANDLSRGCSSEDILHMIAVTTAQSLHKDKTTTSVEQPV
ncbi:phosphate acetyltransferase [Roseibium sp. HPY-6]|uniref:phosphate acetyltransferase n=1 Tax=Roseibium sp. HPY-6 TaxID=3229852 RepID=UPI00338FAEB1